MSAGRWFWSFMLVAVVVGCEGQVEELDGGAVEVADAGVDAGVDVELDAGFDAGDDDAGFDAGVDDAGLDAGVDAGLDAGAPDACVPSTCTAGVSCGAVDDGCGGTLACGACAGGMTCVSGACEAPTGYPMSAADALARSPYWNPATQVPMSGDVTTTQNGQIIANLYLANGEIIVRHDNVQIRNVTVEGDDCADTGNHPINIEAGAQNVVISGARLGSTEACWDAACGRPMFPSSGIVAQSNSSYSVQGCAVHLTGDAFKYLPAAGLITATIEDCFTELGLGIWSVGMCEADHTDSIQLQQDGPVDITVRRTAMSALPYERLSADAGLTRATTPGGATGLQASRNSTGSMTYEDVYLHSGNFILRFNLAPLSVRMVNVTAEGATSGTLQAPTNLTVVEWRGNTYNGAPWLAP